MAYGVYSVTLNDTAVTGAITLVQVNAASTVALEILRAWVSQNESETSTQEEIQVLRVTSAGTGTAATPRALGGYAAAASTATTNHSGEGTAGDSLLREGWNILNGWIWIPAHEHERIIVPPSGRISLKLPEAPEASTTITAGLVFREIG